MSFNSTSLGQGRRVDHYTFLNKPNPTNRPPSSQSSHSYGAPLGSRSPPKQQSSSARKTNPDDNSADEPALARFARLKQRDQNISSRPGASTGPRTITSPPKPEKWSVKDTSVNIATAFHQAATTVYDMQPSNPNNSWASGSRTTATVPRSTSVEYEKETHSTSTRRLAPPPNRLTAPTSRTGAARKPVSKQASVRHVPDSEGEEEGPVSQNGRAKSPFEQVVDGVRRSLAPATFFLRQRSQEPEELRTPTTNGHKKDTSYDYSAEEREFQAAQQNVIHSRNAHATHKRNRMSTDNKAYRPTQSDLEDSDEDFEDDEGKTRRRKKPKKKQPVGGPLTHLPQIGYDKRKKKKGRGSKGNFGGEEEEESDEEDVSDEVSALQRAPRPPSQSGSVRGSLLPQHDDNGDVSIDIEQGLESIPEIDERPRSSSRAKSADRQSRRGFSVGGALGKLVHLGYSGSMSVIYFVLQLIGMIFFLLGRVLGTVFEVIFLRPLQWITSTNTGPLFVVGKYFLLALTLYSAWYMREPFMQHLPSLPSLPTIQRPYYPSDIPPADIVEFSDRLQRIENAISGLSLDTERSRTRQDTATKSHSELIGRLGALESRVQKESIRAVEAEEQFMASANQGLKAVKQEVEELYAQIQAHQKEDGEKSGESNDDEARVKLKALEERVGSVEGGVKEALKLGKSAGKAGSAWWDKIAGGSKGLTIRSSDGQDVTSLIGHLVDSAVSKYSKDTLARPDFALHSGGAMIIPSLTSQTFEMRPQNLRGHIVGLITGNGYAIGRPPITALHHELHNGHCWPFAGSEGQLGVALAAPAYISDVTIDHVAADVAFDMRSAPREMEVWGMVEGKENIAKVKAWQADKARRRKELEEKGGEVPEELRDVPYPKTLPKSPQYIRLTKFSYNIHAPNHIQTFPVDKAIRELGVDFGIVTLRVRSNWGREEFTCLYRMRVHGQRMGETPLPYPEES